jgi:hypothetical protein
MSLENRRFRPRVDFLGFLVLVPLLFRISKAVFQRSISKI